MVGGGTGTTLFAGSPQILSLASLFAASVWRQNWKEYVVIRPSVKLPIREGNHRRLCTGRRRRCVIYVWVKLILALHAVISQGYLCTGSRVYTSARHFDINAAPIVVWRKMLAGNRCFVAPGVTIGHGTVVGARSSVFKSLPANAICRGNPGNAPALFRKPPCNVISF